MFVSCVLLVTIYVVRDEACHDVATSINEFYFILIDVGHHLGVGRVSRSVTLHWSDVRAGRLEGDLAARARTLWRNVIGPRVCVSGQAVDAKLSTREHVVFSSEGRVKVTVLSLLKCRVERRLVSE